MKSKLAEPVLLDPVDDKEAPPVVVVEYPDKRPSSREKAVIAAALAKVSNSDLPPEDRPTRDAKELASYPAGSVVEFAEAKVEVLGPGRGKGWMYVGWVDADGPCLGQVHIDQIEGNL